MRSSEGKDVSDEYDDTFLVLLGYKIKKKRIEMGLTQKELADKVGIDQSDLSKLEKGLLNPTVKMIHRIAKGLNSTILVNVD